MRFTIDLLEGKGLPQKSRPGTIALAAVPFLIPVLVSGLLAAGWYNNHSQIKNERMILRQNEQTIEEHTEALKGYQDTQQKILQARHELKNVSEALAFEIPTSPLLLELVQALPGGVFFNKLEIDYQPVRRKVINPEDNQVVYKRVIERKLRMTLAGPNRIESDQAVDEYIQILRSSPFLSQVAQEVQINSRQEAELDNQTMILYEIECPFIQQ